MSGSEVLGAYFGEYYVISVLLVVRNLTFVVWEKQAKISSVISEEKVCVFHFKHISSEINP
jgi:hypothetical protein